MNFADHWQFWALLSATFAALTAILTKVGVTGIDPDLAQLIRTVVVVLALTVALYAFGKFSDLSPITRRNWVYLVLAGLATCASWTCYFRALKIGEVSRVAAIDKLSIAMVALFAAITLQERLPLLGWVGVALAALGALCLSLAR